MIMTTAERMTAIRHSQLQRAETATFSIVVLDSHGRALVSRTGYPSAELAERVAANLRRDYPGHIIRVKGE